MWETWIRSLIQEDATIFFENRENLLRELDSVIGSLEKYRDALRDGNRDEMRELLKEGREIKERTLYYEKN